MSTIRVKKLNEEVFFSEDPIVELTKSDLSWLKDLAQKNRRETIRLCAHQTTDDPIHEMFIAHSKNTYVRPHKHRTKSVSFHVIEGEAELILFNDAGDITQVVPMGDLTTGRRFYCRIPKSQYYTQLITSDYVVLHETIIGPHERELTSWAPWAPDQEVDQASRDYLARLKSETGAFISAAGDAHLT